MITMTKRERFDGLRELRINILTDELPEEYLPYATFLAADCDADTLRGCYDGQRFVSPPWEAGVLAHEEDPVNLLVIRGIEALSERAQTKFELLLKYKKSYVTELPDNCDIVVLAPREFTPTRKIAMLMSRVYD